MEKTFRSRSGINRLNTYSRIHQLLVSSLLAIVIVFALSKSISINTNNGNNGGILWILVWLICSFIIDLSLTMAVTIRIRNISRVFGFLFSLFFVLGMQLHTYQSLSQLFLSAYSVVSFLLQLVGTTILFSALLVCIFNYSLIYNSSAYKDSTPCRIFSSNKKSIILVGVLIFLSWFPYYLVFYPGILTQDSISEIQAILQVVNFSNHHPFIHQLTVKPFLMVGLALNSLSFGVGLYSLFQMIVMASIYSICIWYTAKINLPYYYRVFLFAYYSLIMTNALYSITMWKDILFGGITLLLMILLFKEVISFSSETSVQVKRNQILQTVALVIVCFFYCVYRNNGYYAFLLAFPLFTFVNRTQWKRYISVFLIVIILVTTYQHLIFNILGVRKSSIGESLSIPMQQIARTVKNHGVDITTGEYDILGEIFHDFSNIGRRYDPTISDPVKSTFRQNEFRKDPLRYTKAWLRLGAKYPGTYVTAFLCQNYGYWYPDVSYWIASFGIIDNSIGLKQNTRFELVRSLVIFLYSQNRAQPLISVFYSVGFMVWVVIISAGILLVKRRGKLASPLLLLAGLWLTTCASPVFCEYRYIFGLIISAPLCIGIAFWAKSEHPLTIETGSST